MRFWHKKQGRTELCIKQLKSVLHYTPETGIFRYTQNANPRMVGKIAGALDGWGYNRISIHGQSYQAHRLAWFYVHGEWPDGYLDHIDGQPWNNSISNLRIATNSENAANRRNSFDRPNLAKGVTKTIDGKFKAQIKCKGTVYYLGTYRTVKEASAAYYSAAQKHFGEFARESIGAPEVHYFPYGTSRKKRGLPPLQVDALERRSKKYRRFLDD